MATGASSFAYTCAKMAETNYTLKDPWEKLKSEVSGEGRDTSAFFKKRNSNINYYSIRRILPSRLEAEIKITPTPCFDDKTPKHMFL